MLIHAKIYFPEAITKILWTYALKAFVEKINVIKVNGYRITPIENFVVTTTAISIKITTHGSVQFMSWMKYCKEIYLD